MGIVWAVWASYEAIADAAIVGTGIWQMPLRVQARLADATTVGTSIY